MVTLNSFTPDEKPTLPKVQRWEVELLKVATELFSERTMLSLLLSLRKLYMLAGSHVMGALLLPSPASPVPYQTSTELAAADRLDDDNDDDEALGWGGAWYSYMFWASSSAAVSSSAEEVGSSSGMHCMAHTRERARAHTHTHTHVHTHTHTPAEFVGSSSGMHCMAECASAATGKRLSTSSGRSGRLVSVARALVLMHRSWSTTIEGTTPLAPPGSAPTPDWTCRRR